MKHLFLNSITIILFFLSLSIFVSAQNDREKGIELFKNGKNSEAIGLLEKVVENNKNDAEVWNYLGLAYANTNKLKDARKSIGKAVNYSPQSSIYRANLAYVYLLERKIDKAQGEIEKAIQLDPNNANAFYIRGTSYLWEKDYDKTISDADKAIQLDKNLSSAYILKSDGLLYTFGTKWREENEPLKSLYLLQNASDTLKNCSGSCLTGSGSEIVKERLETIVAFTDYFNRTKITVDNSTLPSSEQKTPFKVLNKPNPTYTDQARQNNEKGNVILAILFGSDSKIKYIIVLEGLNYGLNDQAIAAAKKIQFEPEMRNGKPVASVKKVIYNFDIH